MIRRDFFKTSFTGLALALPFLEGRGESSGGENPPEAPQLTRYVAEFVARTKYSDLPEQVIELGKKSILDAFGLALAGSLAQSGVLVRKYIERFGSPEAKSTVMGTSMKAAPRFAAFANGVGIHADDFDDTQLAAAKDRVYGLLVHPTVPVLPAAFALAELSQTSGKELMLAYHLGVEVECKIAEAISPRHYEDGFHTTGTCGPFGGAVASAKLRNLDLERTLNALGIAGSEAAGLRENFGTMTKPFHAGHAAESGVVAVELAELGWTATHKILEAPRGFFHAYGGSFDSASIFNRLGNPWTFSSPGISIKPFPCGSLTHPGMTKLLQMIHDENIKAADVERVDAGTNRNLPNTLIHHRPTNGLEAKFSMEYCLAILLLERKAGLGEFTDERARRSDVQEMLRRINFYVDPVAEKAGYDKMTTILKIHLKDGRVLSGRADFGKGSPSDPMSYEDVADKFRGSAEFAHWPRENSEAIINFVRMLEQASDVRKLAALLANKKS